MRDLNQVGVFLKKQAPTILSCVGAAGVIATAWASFKAAPMVHKRRMQLRRVHEKTGKEEPTKLEYAKVTWKYYIPTAIIGASTIACIFGSNSLNQKQRAALASAYMLLDNSYKNYRKKVEEQLGDGSDEYIQKHMIEDTYQNSYDKFVGETHLFYEFNYGDFFERSRGEVLSAEHRFNERFAKNGYASLNDLYELLGLPKTEAGNVLGWTLWEECKWIDFTHEFLELEDGMECYIIKLSSEPVIDPDFY